MNRIEKLKNDIYSFEELDTMEKNALQLGDQETLGLIAHSRMSKTVRGDKRVVLEKKPKSPTTKTKKPEVARKDRRKAKRGKKAD